MAVPQPRLVASALPGSHLQCSGSPRAVLGPVGFKRTAEQFARKAGNPLASLASQSDSPVGAITDGSG